MPDLCRCYPLADSPKDDCPIHGLCPINRDSTTGRFKEVPKPGWNDVPVLIVHKGQSHYLETSPWFIPTSCYGPSTLLAGEIGAIECPPPGRKLVWEKSGGAWSRTYYPAFRLVEA